MSAEKELVQKHCHMAVDFESELTKWTDDRYYADHVYKIQLPYSQVSIDISFLHSSVYSLPFIL